jgi:undecaprenyl diphosphate synthase
VIKVTEFANAKGITHLTLWGLSTENLQKRSTDEVKGLIKIVNSIEGYLKKMDIASLRFNVIGDVSRLPDESQAILQRVMNNTRDNTGITLTLALIYG